VEVDEEEFVPTWQYEDSGQQKTWRWMTLNGIQSNKDINTDIGAHRTEFQGCLVPTW